MRIWKLSRKYYGKGDWHVVGSGPDVDENEVVEVVDKAEFDKLQGLYDLACENLKNIQKAKTT